VGICDDLNEPQTSIVIVFYLVYDNGSRYSTSDSKEQVKLKPQGTTTIPYVQYVFESRSYI
jgi:hypothetical protein